MRQKRLLAAVLAIVIALNLSAGFSGGLSEAEASGAPAASAPVTQANILSLLKQYDPDGFYILKKQIRKNDDILQWFSGSSVILDGINTAVHEETHGYSFAYRKKGKTAYFVGNKKTVYVKQTKIYRSKKMAGSIPQDLRTARYSVYIADPSKNLSSNVQGAYGLLNEFMAYCSGMHTTLCLYPYLESEHVDWDMWERFIVSCENDKLAYAEFRYYVLHYLYYAKKHYPKVYKGILKNKAFCKAYRKIERRFAGQVAEYEADLLRLKAHLENAGKTLILTDGEAILYSRGGGTGVGRYTSDYKNLMQEMEKKRYQNIHAKLLKNGK